MNLISKRSALESDDVCSKPTVQRHLRWSEILLYSLCFASCTARANALSRPRKFAGASFYFVLVILIYA